MTCEFHPHLDKILIGTNNADSPNFLMETSVTFVKLQDKKQKVFSIGQKMPHEEEVNKARYNRSGSLIASKTHTGNVKIYKDNQYSKTIAANSEEGFGLAFSPHEDLSLATAGYDGKAYIFDLETGKNTCFSL